MIIDFGMTESREKLCYYKNWKAKKCINEKRETTRSIQSRAGGKKNVKKELEFDQNTKGMTETTNEKSKSHSSLQFQYQWVEMHGLWLQGDYKSQVISGILMDLMSAEIFKILCIALKCNSWNFYFVVLVFFVTTRFLDKNMESIFLV